MRCPYVLESFSVAPKNDSTGVTQVLSNAGNDSGNGKLSVLEVPSDSDSKPTDPKQGDARLNSIKSIPVSGTTKVNTKKVKDIVNRALPSNVMFPPAPKPGEMHCMIKTRNKCILHQQAKLKSVLFP